MKLLNLTSRNFAIALLIIIPAWASIFYYTMLDEIYDSIDDGLDNQKGLIVRKVEADSSLLNKSDFDEGDYAIRPIAQEKALGMFDQYIDTMMYMENEKSEEPVRMLKTYFLHNGSYYELQVVTSMVEEDDLLRHLFYSLIWLYAGLVITILIINNFLLRKTWKPFQNLMHQLRSYRIDKPSKLELNPSGVEEFTNLNLTVQKLLDRNMLIYSNQKQFIENASHELQTPLAIAMTKLETLAGDPALTSEQISLLSTALDNLDRLTRLNRSLILLSRIGNRQFPDVTRVKLHEVVRKVLNDFQDQADYHHLTVTLRENEPFEWSMNPDLALIMMTNLIKNAIVHNKRGGYIHVEVHSHRIDVENSGADHPLDATRIFERFHTENTGRGSMGLGLALVKAIADSYGLNVSYAYQNAHRITVKIPG
jgi:signal transduction histidine kinase